MKRFHRPQRRRCHSSLLVFGLWHLCLPYSRYRLYNSRDNAGPTVVWCRGPANRTSYRKLSLPGFERRLMGASESRGHAGMKFAKELTFLLSDSDRTTTFGRIHALSEPTEQCSHRAFDPDLSRARLFCALHMSGSARFRYLAKQPLSAKAYARGQW